MATPINPMSVLDMSDVESSDDDTGQFPDIMDSDSGEFDFSDEYPDDDGPEPASLDHLLLESNFFQVWFL